MADNTDGRLNPHVLGRDTPPVPLGVPHGVNAPRIIVPAPTSGPPEPPASTQENGNV